MKAQRAAQDRRESAPQKRLPLTGLAVGGVALLVLGFLAYGLLSGPSTAFQPGSPVPGFQLTALDGTAMHLAEQRGSVVVLNFFASWCAPCREEAAGLESVWRDYQLQGVQFYGIAYKDAESKVQVFLDEFGITYPIAVEPGNRTARAYGVTGVPETFVVDQDGLLVKHYIGPVSQAQLGAVLDSLVGQ